MNPLDDHELLLWAMRAGLTRDEVRQAVQRGLEEGAIPRQSADETQAQRINLDREAILVVAGMGGFTVGAYGLANSAD